MNNPHSLTENAAKAARLLKVMSNESRLMILCSLQGKALSVGELNDIIPLSQSALSQHLAALRNANLVSSRKESQVVFYSVTNEAPGKIIEILKKIYCPDEAI